MQKVERKKRRARKHGRLIGLALCALLLAGCVTAAVLLRKMPADEPVQPRKRVTGAITSRRPEELVSLTITRRGEEPWTAVREEGGSLRLLKEGSEEETDTWIVDENVGSMIQDAAVNLTYEDVFTENRADWEPDKADFGLDDPLVTAVFRFTDGAEVTARIGESADPDNKAYYYLVIDGDDRLYAVSSGTVQDLNVDRSILHPVHQLQIRGVLLNRITVKDGDGKARTEWALQGGIADRDAAENWLVTAPFRYPADYEAMTNLRETAENLRLGTYVCEADEQAMEKYGMTRPAAVLEFHMSPGSTGTVGMGGLFDISEWEERTVTLTIGSAKSEMVDYVLYGDEIFTVNHFTTSVFTETDPMTTAARYPVAIPLNSLESVMVEREGEETVHYALLRVTGEAKTEENPDEEEPAGEEAAEDTAEAETTVRCLRNGAEIPYDTFAAAYERILTVTVSGRLPEGYEPKPAHTKYTFHTVSGGTHTAELSDYDGMHDAVTMDGYTLFYLIKGGMTELP